MSNFPSSPTRNITSHSKENLAFHSLLRWKMILIQILTTLLMHFLFRRLGECTFWAQESKRVKTSSCVTHLYTVYYAGQCMDTYCCTLPKDTISWEDGTFLLQTQDHVINGVARGVDCPQCSTICWQQVPIIQVAVVSWAATYFFLLLPPRKLGNPYLGSLGEGNGGQFMILTLSVLRSKSTFS